MAIGSMIHIRRGGHEFSQIVRKRLKLYLARQLSRLERRIHNPEVTSSTLVLATKAFRNESLSVFYTMDQFVVYVLFSLSSGKTYTGMTSDLLTRFHFHNLKSTKGFTVRFRPWIVVHIEYFTEKSEALLREKELKSGKGRDWLKSNVLKSYQKS